MLTNSEITGIDPFVPWSTFKCDTLTVPRGLFYGGCFYTSDAFVAPLHISYIAGADSDYLSIWGIEDAANTPMGIIRFSYDSENIGHIFTPSGEYAGCLKGRLYNANAQPVTSGATTSRISDLSVFLNNITGTHQLDLDSLILDCCYCCRVPDANVGGGFNSLQIPPDGKLEQLSNGYYYIGVASGGSIVSGTDYLTKLQISGGILSGSTIVSSGLITLSGAHISITPWCAMSGATWSSVGVEDAVVTVIDGGVVIGTHKAVADYGA